MQRFAQRNLITLKERAEGEETSGSIGTLTGYIAVFNSDSYDLGGFTEQVKPGAFTETLKENDVVALVNHDHSAVVGRLSAKTLRLEEDSTGLRFEVDLPDTQPGRDVLTLVKRADLLGCSFGFEILDDTWTSEDGKEFCSLDKVSLWEVSIGVTFPAYPETSCESRDRHKAHRKRALLRYRARLALLKVG
jgi:uncharacterized protein